MHNFNDVLSYSYANIKWHISHQHLVNNTIKEFGVEFHCFVPFYLCMLH